MSVTKTTPRPVGLPPPIASQAGTSAPTKTIGSTQRAASRNRTRIAAGVFTMIACALAAVMVFNNAASRSLVLVVGRPVGAGETIENSDLREALVGSSPRGSTIDAVRRVSIVGRTAAVDLVADALLSPGQLTEGPAAGTGRAVIGATLKEGQFPVELAAGDRILAVTLPAESIEPTATDNAAGVEATVVGIRPLDDGSGIALSLAVAPDMAPSLAIAGARSRLTLVLAPR